MIKALLLIFFCLKGAFLLGKKIVEGQGFFLLFIFGGNGGCAIAIVALVTIKEDLPSSSSYIERLCYRDILYTS
jgi:hypothetical protein